MNRTALVVLLLSLTGAPILSLGQSGASEPLKLETTIPMAEVQGRIDHFSIDVKGQGRAARSRPSGAPSMR